MPGCFTAGFYTWTPVQRFGRRPLLSTLRDRSLEREMPQRRLACEMPVDRGGAGVPVSRGGLTRTRERAGRQVRARGLKDAVHADLIGLLLSRYSREKHHGDGELSRV